MPSAPGRMTTSQRQTFGRWLPGVTDTASQRSLTLMATSPSTTTPCPPSLRTGSSPMTLAISPCPSLTTHPLDLRCSVCHACFPGGGDVVWLPVLVDTGDAL